MKLSDGEWTVMNAVWARSPSSTRDVLERVGAETGWAYTTVKTILSRLVQKGALTARMRANTSLYEPSITRDQARRTALRSLIDRAFGGAVGPLVQHLMSQESLSPRDRERLERMLAELDDEPEGGE